MSHNRYCRAHRLILSVLGVSATTLAALTSAPAANADFQYDGTFIEQNGRRIDAHWRLYGYGGDLSKPSGTITNADGCTIDTVLADPDLYTKLPGDSVSWFMRGHVTSGGGPNCLDTMRLSVLCSKNPVTALTEIPH